MASTYRLYHRFDPPDPLTLRSAGLSYDAATARLKAAMGGAARPVALGLRVLGFDVATPAPPEALLGQGYSTETDVQEPGGANGAAAAADESAAQMVNTSPGFDALSFAEPGTAAGFGKPAAAGTAAASTGFGGVTLAKPSTGGGLFATAGTAGVLTKPKESPSANIKPGEVLKLRPLFGNTIFPKAPLQVLFSEVGDLGITWVPDVMPLTVQTVVSGGLASKLAKLVRCGFCIVSLSYKLAKFLHC